MGYSVRDLDILAVAATSFELEAIAGACGPLRSSDGSSGTWREGALSSHSVGLVCSGIGKVNTAMALSKVLSSVRPRLLISLGVGGAFSLSGLRPGDLAVATAEVYGDEGAMDGEQWLGLEALGFPAWEGPGGQRWYNRLPVHPEATACLQEASTGVGKTASGSFLTVSTTTGSYMRSRELETRFGAVCENMEGAAAAHVALAHAIPFAEVRGISNLVGPRNRAAWRLEEAARAAGEAVARFLQLWKRSSEGGASDA